MARLAKELDLIRKDGRYDYHLLSENSMGNGTLMVVGPDDSPYFGGFYFYRINLPSDYPMSPPKVKFLTSGKRVRFHPNMYIDGKVCLSILGTWVGPSWTPVMTLLSLFQTIESILTKYALRHEGATKCPAETKAYDDMLKAANIDIAICEQLLSPPEFAIPFLSTMDTRFLANYDKLHAFTTAQTVIPDYMYSAYGSLLYKVEWRTILAKLEATHKRVMARR